MHRLRAAAVLLLVAAAWAPLVQGGTADDPELEDAAGDQTVTRPGNPQIPPVIPGVNDEAFDDIDLMAAWFEERTLDCVGEAELDCPLLTLMVKTTAGWTTGTLTGNFTLRRGPTSYAHSNATASGTEIAFTVQGTTVSGIANSTADVGPDGLRIRFPIPRIGAVGGDVLTGLTLAATRTDVGTVTDPAVTQDDQTGSDTAGPGGAYTMSRPDPVTRWSLRVVSVNNVTGPEASVPVRQSVLVAIEITNAGTDRARTNIEVRSEQLPSADRTIATPELDPFASARLTFNVSMDQAEPGRIILRLFAIHNDPVLDANPEASARINYEPLAADREVVPAGLDFLTPAAESVGLDGAFGKYAELVLLALIVLVVILAIFLLVALAPSTLAGASAPEAPPLKGSEAAPAGLLPLAPPAADEPEPMELVPESAAATKGGALKIESVEHSPEAPEEGEEVMTEVVLRNPGPTRQVRVVLAADDLDRDEAALTLPARATKTVRLSWTAGPGENKVRVRVLPT